MPLPHELPYSWGADDGDRGIYAASASSSSDGDVIFDIRRTAMSLDAASQSSGAVSFGILSSKFRGDAAAVSGGSLRMFRWQQVFDFITPQRGVSRMSASVRQATPDTPDPQSLVLRLSGAANANVNALLYVDRKVPLGVGARLLRADLVLKKSAPWPSGNHDIYIDAISEVWDASSVTWNTQPDVRVGGVMATIPGGGVAGDEVRLNITQLLSASVAQDEAAGFEWLGVRLTTASAGELQFYSAFAPPEYRIEPDVEWTIPPHAPFDLEPSAMRAVSKTQPTLFGRFSDPDAEDTISAVQVRVQSNGDDFTTPSFDSGKLSATRAEQSLSGLYSVSQGNTYAWQMKVWDNHDAESPWSETAYFVRVPMGTVALDEPAANVSSPTPRFAWTVTGMTQEAFELEVERFTGGRWERHWSMPKTLSTATVVVLPDAYRLEEGVSYRATLRVWDNVTRADLPDDRAFTEITRTLTLATVSI